MNRLFISLILGLLRSYQLLVSPWLGCRCRFVPNCSEYAYEAVKKHGPVRGLMFACCRLLRCHPFAKHGADPVP